MIPPILHRTVPAVTDTATEALWDAACALHPGWEHWTHRDPLNPDAWPFTSPWWPLCESGAQLAGLIRLEALYRWGGIYIDSDVELYRPLSPLLDLHAFAAWEDADTVPDAVMGAEAGHPAIAACIDLAIERIQSGGIDWQTGRGAWATGPGVTTTVLVGRDDVTLLGREAFYPYHYTERHRRSERPGHDDPTCYGAHHWAASWLPPDRRL